MVTKSAYSDRFDEHSWSERNCYIEQSKDKVSDILIYLSMYAIDSFDKLLLVQRYKVELLV